MLNDVYKIIKDFEDKYNAKVIYLTKSGSKLYGTDNENSDTDYKGIFIPSKESVLLKKDLSTFSNNTNNTNTKNSKDDIDLQLHSIYHFFNSLKKSETGSIDLFFSMFYKDNQVINLREYTNTIKDNQKYLINKNMRSFIGYALGQAKKYGIKGQRYNELDIFVKELLETLDDETLIRDNKGTFNSFIEKYNLQYTRFIMAKGPRNAKGNSEIEYLSVLGKMFMGNITIKEFKSRILHLYKQFGNRTLATAQTKDKTDFKALSHAYRVVSEMKELLLTNKIVFPLKEKDYIKSIKEQKENTEDVINKIEIILEEVDYLLENSDLPEISNEDKINELILNLLDKKEM